MFDLEKTSLLVSFQVLDDVEYKKQFIVVQMALEGRYSWIRSNSLSLRVNHNDFMTSVEDWPQPLPVEKLTFSVTQARLPWTQNKLLG